MVVAGCSGDPGSNGNRKGGEGASCLTTNDCTSPLECHDNVCVNPAAPTPDVVGDTSPPPDDVTSDADPVEDATEEETIEDVASPEDVVLPFEVVQDAKPPPDDPGPLPDAPPDSLNPLGECENVGVPSDWEGSFEGEVDYDLGQPIPGLIEKDILPVDGTLSFSIECIENKFVVLGEMNGVALGANPFTMKLSGGYNPTTGTMTAKMVDAKVVIFGIVEVYFEGDFEGSLQPGGTAMVGTWAGEATGNNVGLMSVVAEGEGTWDALAQ